MSSIERIRHFFLKREWFKEEYIQPDMGRDSASVYLHHMLTDDNPCMVSRFGFNELRIVTTYLRSQKRFPQWNYMLGRTDAWWYRDYFCKDMEQCAGFFPATKENLDRFAQLYLEDMKEIDVLGSWLADERQVLPYLNKNAKRTWISFLEPFWATTPYTAALTGKKILVVHPFADTIKAQYDKRALLHANANTLPDCASFEVIPAVQSIGGCADGFSDWFEALDYMKDKIDCHDYEICLIGCGAYGLPLAAHVKRQGKKAIHMGGALQLLFGIWGQRWEEMEHIERDGVLLDWKTLPNEHWVRPAPQERPRTYKNVENGCYW